MAAEVPVIDVIEIFDESQIPANIRTLILRTLGEHGRLCIHEEQSPIVHKPVQIYVDREPKRRPKEKEPTILVQILTILSEHNILVTQYLSTTIGRIVQPVEA